MRDFGIEKLRDLGIEEFGDFELKLSLRSVIKIIWIEYLKSKIRNLKSKII